MQFSNCFGEDSTGKESLHDILLGLKTPLLRARIENFESLREAIKNGKSEIEITYKNDNSIIGYFSADISIIKNYKNNQNLERLNILIPAAKVGDQWRCIYPDNLSENIIVSIDSMETGFDSSLVAVWVSKYSEDLDRRLSKRFK